MFLFFIALVFCFNDENPQINSVNLRRGFDFRNPEDTKDVIFDWGYDKGKTYKFPEMPDIVFNVPDEQTIKTRIRTSFLSNVGIYDSYSKIISTLLSEYDIHESGKLSNESYGHDEFIWVKEEMNKNCSCGIAELYFSHFMAVPDPYMFLDINENFSESVEELPKKVETKEDKKMFYEFVYRYGTHFIEQGVYGGDIKIIICMNRTIIRTKSQAWITRELNKYYYYKVFDLDNGGYSKRTDIHVDPQFWGNASSKFIFEGGIDKYQTEDSLLDWKDSLYPESGRINSTLTFISELIDDGEKSSSLKDIIVQYIKKGPLAFKLF